MRWLSMSLTRSRAISETRRPAEYAASSIARCLTLLMRANSSSASDRLKTTGNGFSFRANGMCRMSQSRFSVVRYRNRRAHTAVLSVDQLTFRSSTR